MIGSNNRTILLALLAVVVSMLLPVSTKAYVDLAPTLAKIISDSRHIAVVEVVDFDRAGRTLVLKEVKSLKGDASTELMRHDIAPADGTTIPRQISQWAAPGARGVIFASRATALVCVGRGWYQVRGGEGLMKLGADRPDLPLAYLGTVSRLIESIERMLSGKDAVLTVVAFGADNEGASFDLALNRQNLPGLARIQRIRANLSMPGMVMGASSNPNYFLGLGAVDEAELPQLISELKSPDPLQRRDAAADIRTLGPKGAVAAEALAPLLNDPSDAVRVAAASALLRVGPANPAALEILAEAMDGPDVALRRQAATASGLAGPSGGALAPNIAKLLSNPDESTRLAALQAISLLGKDAAASVNATIPLLDDKEFQIDAADALGRIGSAATPALSKLATMLNSEESQVRWAAVRAMSQIGGPDAHPAVEFMIRALPTATEVEGYNMMIYLSLLGPVASDALPTLWQTPIKNPVLPSATEWAMSPEKYFPWEGRGGSGRGGRGGRGPGGPGGGRGPGGGGDIFSLIYQAYVRELGERLRPAAKVLAQRIMDGTAGDVPQWGYEILSAGPEEAVSIFSPYLTGNDAILRERAAVAIGFMGSSANAAMPALQRAIDNASTEQERRLLQWSARAIERD